MGLKSHVITLASQTASETVDPEVQKLLQQQRQSNVSAMGEITKIHAPDSFDVNVGGVTKTITYLGNRPVGKGSNVILDGDHYAR